jgi:ABC-type multidrug transport system fused ATPase/permease subunit
LICRFYDLSEGAIELDGTDIRQLKVADYRRQIGLVLQEPFLFFGTIAETSTVTRWPFTCPCRSKHRWKPAL